jgi:pilus assembly protein CpaF
MMGTIALPEKAIRAQIASAIDLIIQVARMSDGSRRITHISEITGTSGDIVSMQDIFVFERMGVGPSGNVKGRFSATGVVPKFDERLKAAGIPLNMALLEHNPGALVE